MKVLDFGLGRLHAADAPAAADPLSSPTLTRRDTRAGVILGTAPYMSPEQARGQAVDRRTDIWAFGVILFEMLTGARLFRGETTSDVLAGVLKTEVEWDRLPAGTPPAARRLLRRCLERDPRERLHDFADVRIEIEQAVRELERPETDGIDHPARQRWPAALPWGIAALAVAAAAAVAVARRTAPTPARVSRLVLPLQPRPLTMGGFALSPDGARLAYVADGRIHVRPLAARPADRARGGPWEPSLLLPGRRLDRLRRSGRVALQGPRIRGTGGAPDRPAQPGRPVRLGPGRHDPLHAALFRRDRESCCGSRLAGALPVRLRPARQPGEGTCGGHTSFPGGGPFS